MLTFSKLRETNLSRTDRWNPRGLETWDLSGWTVAMMGEAGEACNVIKKLNRIRDGMTGNRIGEKELQRALTDELADIVIYLDLLAARAGINLESAIIHKFNETSARVGFPERL